MRISRRRFEEIALQAVRDLPAEFRPYARECALSVERRPSREVLEKLGVPEDEDLFGYYEGVAVIDRHVDDLPGAPPRIILYREPLMAACASEEELKHEIQVTVLHELGHHFGLDEGRLAELGFE
jgi:predicted Zn-dependent protease with MMP-like domain